LYKSAVRSGFPLRGKLSNRTAYNTKQNRHASMTTSQTSEVAYRVFLRACAALRPADWDGQESALRALDSEGWEVVSKLAVRHGLLGLVARNLDWAHRRSGITVPIMEKLTAWRQGQLVQMLVRRNAARRVADALAAGGIRFVIFKGMALVEQVYGDLSLRAFRDCDILVDRDRLEAAYAILLSLGHSLTQYESVHDYLVRDKANANLTHPDGSSVDLHWAIERYGLQPSDPEIIWRNCRPEKTSQHLPGWRMSPELTLINVAAHFQLHEYEEFKPLVDFYLTALSQGWQIDIETLFRTAHSLGMLRSVDLAARLCERFFIPNPLVQRLAGGKPSTRMRLASSILTEKGLLRLEKLRPIELRLRCLICYGASPATAKALRKMFLPKARELELRFRRPFAFGMYPRYYMAQAYRLFARTRRPFSDWT
jgi:Uncharacterised nucleotidyltransferase